MRTTLIYAIGYIGRPYDVRCHRPGTQALPRDFSYLSRDPPNFIGLGNELTCLPLQHTTLRSVLMVPDDPRRRMKAARFSSSPLPSSLVPAPSSALPAYLPAPCDHAP